MPTPRQRLQSPRPSRRTVERVLAAVATMLVTCVSIVIGAALTPSEARAATAPPAPAPPQVTTQGSTSMAYHPLGLPRPLPATPAPHLATHAQLTAALQVIVERVDVQWLAFTRATGQVAVTETQLAQLRILTLASLVLLLNDLKPGLGATLEAMLFPDDLADEAGARITLSAYDPHEAPTVPAPLAPLRGL